MFLVGREKSRLFVVVITNPTLIEKTKIGAETRKKYANRINGFISTNIICSVFLWISPVMLQISLEITDTEVTFSAPKPVPL